MASIAFGNEREPADRASLSSVRNEEYPKNFQAHINGAIHPPRQYLLLFFCYYGWRQIMKTGDKTAYINQLKQRHSSLAWWARTSNEYPLGVVPISTAARILHVTPNRVRQLIKDSRIRVLSDMPGGSSHDRFVPIVDLLDAPFAMTRGRPGVYGPKNRLTKEKYKTSDIRRIVPSDKGLR